MARADILHTVDFRPETLAEQPVKPTGRYDISFEEGWDPDKAAALWERASTASIFNHPAWWGAAIDSYGRDRRIIGVCVHSDGELCGYWPFWEKRLGPKDAFARVLEPVGARHTDYVMPLVARYYDRPAMMARMLEKLKEELSPSTLILWSKADRVRSADKAVTEAFPGDRFLVHRHIRRCPRMTLPPSFEELKQQWSRNHRSQLRRRTRRLQEMGDLTLHVAQTRDEILSGIETLIAMHRVNWSDRGEGSEFDTPENREFLESIASNLPFKLLHYSELRLNGLPLSCNFDFRLDDEILFYKGSFDVQYSRCSPGMVHIAKVSEWAINEGIRVLDFMQGEESYKFNWSNGLRETVSHAIAPQLAFPVWYWNTKLRKLIIEYKV